YSGMCSTLPHVTWILPNGTPLRSGAQLSKFFHRPDGSLIISNPSVAEAGLYRCTGRNFQGLVERAVTLSPGRKPEITNRYNSPVNVMIGDRLLLHCVTSSEPLSLTWTLPSGVLLHKSQRAGRYVVLANGTLAIQQVSVYDRGSYVCRAANEYGSSVLSASVLVIAYPPRITSGPPAVTNFVSLTLILTEYVFSLWFCFAHVTNTSFKILSGCSGSCAVNFGPLDHLPLWELHAAEVCLIYSAWVR
uniref:Ig-like domain-containing protein n=1 Tax=Mola mola TaxID=94237 RepID=A0A3Q3W2P8_MOLML